MNVLVTGGTGFVGKYVIEKLVKKKYNVVCLVRKESDTSFLKQLDNVEFLYGDILQADSLSGISKNINYVVHLAAKGVVEATSKEALQSFLAMNEQGTKNLLNEFKGSKTLIRFIHFSSTAAMGIVGDPLLNEESVPNPETPYQKSKRKSELTVLRMYKEYHIPCAILRPCMIYGVGAKKGEFYKFCRLMKKGVFPKVGLGENLTPLVYVTDVAEAAVLALTNAKNGEVYIISDDTSYPLDEIREEILNNLEVHSFYPFIPKSLALWGAKLIELACKAINKTPIVTYRNMKSTVLDRTFDINKANSQLRYKPQVHLKEGTKLTVEWYRKNNMI